ncbi:hypothetical protein [Microcoleus sp. bin38.metabat.b11b12b14.051]|uniref:hypothetical protein n=1 Tax=Microcoleus sp. bin38.metabat.b11b12b14.051 TaxID=2742709 RepID=UPI0025F441A5|nr:hypothetical protein [Microcoleus sp. bin38.metabat.b11b12b14.051]
MARNRVSATNSVKYQKSRKKPGFWDFGALISVAAWRETGFLRQISVEYEKSRKKPGFWD